MKRLAEEVNLRYLKGVGEQREAIFNKLGAYTVNDLLRYFPFRYEDRRNFKKIKDLKVNEFSVISGKVKTLKLKKMPYFLRSKVKSILEILLEDDTGALSCSWFNQAYLSDSIEVGAEMIVYGKPRIYKNKLQMLSPEFELGPGDDSLSLGRIIGVYRLSSGFTQRFMRKTIFAVLKDYSSDCVDSLPFDIRKEKNLPNIAQALEETHFPTSWEQAERARERFIFEELFFSQILVYLRKAKRFFQKGASFTVKEESISQLREQLPFELTLSQENVLRQILKDLTKSYPMHRLLQGDVGCGKTVVAVFAIIACVDSGYQSALMVPTEVLAYQHKQTLVAMFKRLNFLKNTNESIRIITSSLSKKETESIYEGLRNGKIKIVIGTHALIQKEVEFKNLGLAIIDEQHKFGVAQRALLPKKGKLSPHYLIMSATPIPRSLALSIYGDLDLSVINEMPKKRVLAKTIWAKEKERPEIYKLLNQELRNGRQAYIVYPVIEETDEEHMQSLKSAYQKISKKFSSYSSGMFHGRMKSEEKLEVIQKFREGKIDILVSTTVVEVGVDIANATVMIVENPERFGLAQLHQLRGRIQRSSKESYFILMSRRNLSESSLERLKVISSQTCGFKIAEEDLKLRGPGDFFGSLQHGLPGLRIANPLRDLEILKQARRFAYKMIKKDPHLEKSGNRSVRDYLIGQFGAEILNIDQKSDELLSHENFRG